MGIARGTYKDLIGSKFNTLTVLERVGSQIKPSGNKGHSIWKCQCDCGKIVNILSNALKRKNRRGCSVECPYVYQAQVKYNKSRIGMTYEKQDYLGEGHTYIAEMYRTYRHGARERGYEFKLTRKEFAELVRQNCHYCQALPTVRNKKIKNLNYEAQVNGIDRANNSEGYTLENSVPCCPTCNFMKGSLNSEEFIEQVRKISAVLPRLGVDTNNVRIG